MVEKSWFVNLIKEKKQPTAMKFSSILILLFVIVSLPSSLLGQEIDGTWKAYQYTIEGKVEITFTFETDGGTLKGEATTPAGILEVTDGVVQGSTLSFKLSVGDKNVYYTGYYLREQLLISANYNENNGQITLNRVGG